MTSGSKDSKLVWMGTLKSLAVGFFVFYLGRELAIWLAVRNIHGSLAFLDNVMAGVAAAVLVFLYERRRQRAIAALRESEERLRLAARVGRMFAYSWDITSDAIQRSGEAAGILGVKNDEAATGAAVAAMVHADDKGRLEAALAKLTVENPMLQITYRIIRPDGGITWLERNSRGSFDEQGKMTRMVGMIVDVTERKKAEEALRTSEERMRLAQRAARMGTFECNMKTQKITWTPELEALYGLPPGGFGGSLADFQNCIHPQDREAVTKLVDDAYETRQPVTGEWRVIWPDGSEHWIAGRWQVFMDDSGEPSRAIGVNVDATERKQAEEALAEMSRKLIDAQEQERTRIGSELHDDINQRLALLAIQLEQLADDSSALFRKRVQELRKETTEIANDVQALSHELHSSKLQYLGVIAGMRSWCREFGERRKMDINFASDVTSSLRFETGLSLFRVLQEALHNAAKYSGVKRVEVQLRETSGDIDLFIKDSGKGFDVDTAVHGNGLGLTSMRERVRLVNGTIAIHSRPTAGTTIHVRVPLASRQFPERSARLVS